MSRKLEGHQNCLICHPDLDKKHAKHNMKGNKQIKHSFARDMQESERLLDILVRAEQEIVTDDENN